MKSASGIRVVEMIFVALAVAAMAPRAAYSDTLTLKSGHVFDGVVTESGDDVVLSMPNATITYSRSEVASIVRGPIPQEIYKARAAGLKDDDAEGHYQLGLFAESKGLAQEARKEYEKALAANGDHAGAREKLGYVRENGEWLSRGEAMARKGYVYYRGRYVPADQAEGLKRDARESGDARETRAVVKKLAETIRRSTGQDGKDARDKLAGLSDPAALAPIIEATQDGYATVRAAAVSALANYNADKAALAVLDAAIADDSQDIRYQARAILKTKRNEAAFSETVSLLDADGDLTRFRACQVLGALGDVRAVPYLIDTLSWTREPVQQAQSQAPSAPDLTPPSYGPTYIAGYRSKVAPGVVATEPIIGGFDQYGNRIILNPAPQDLGQGFSETAPEEVLNYDALTALQALTGQDFRFDKVAWRTWYAANARKLRSLPGPARGVSR